MTMIKILLFIIPFTLFSQERMPYNIRKLDTLEIYYGEALFETIQGYLVTDSSYVLDNKTYFTRVAFLNNRRRKISEPKIYYFAKF